MYQVITFFHLKLAQCYRSVVNRAVKKEKNTSMLLLSLWWEPWRIDRPLSFVPLLLEPHKYRKSWSYSKDLPPVMGFQNLHKFLHLWELSKLTLVRK